MPVTACSVLTNDIVEMCYMRGELLLNPAAVGKRAMVAVHVALESIQSNAATLVWHKYVKTVALLKSIKQFGDFVASIYIYIYVYI